MAFYLGKNKIASGGSGATGSAMETTITNLQLNYLTEDQYKNALLNGEINDDELYFTPDDEIAIDILVENSLESDSTTNVPSVQAVNKGIENAIKSAENLNRYEEEILWENPNSSAIFNAQTIVLKNNNYKYCTTFYKNSNGEIFSNKFIFAVRNSSLNTSEYTHDATKLNGIKTCTRYIRDIGNTSMRFTGCNTCSAYSSGIVFLSDNLQCVPIRVTGTN